MKRLFILFLILFSVCSIRAQNLNFKDTNSLKSLLCSHAWIRYAVSEDSTISDRIMDSITFYPNHTFFQSARPSDDRDLDWIVPKRVIRGMWGFSGTAKASLKDLETDCVNVSMVESNKASSITLQWRLALVDGKRIRSSKFTRAGNVLGQPFIVYSFIQRGIEWDIEHIWRVPK